MIAADLFNAVGERAAFAELASHHDLSTRCDAIKAFYESALPQIMDAKPGEWGIDPFEVYWSAVFSPIERVMWQILRSERVVMYPQFPVGRYFVDFGNPQQRVAIECDGAEFHADLAKDDDRTWQLHLRGWKTYRFTGSECFAEVLDDEFGGLTSYARRSVREIAERHGLIKRVA